MSIPRSEHPRPQSIRDDWLCLNGAWDFADDPGDSGEQRGLVGTDLPDRIVVPFCRESQLSGLERVDRCLAVWYGRELEIPAAWAGKRVLLHVGAADYEATVWLGDRELARHRGGHVPFTVELTPHLQPGASGRLTIRCRDDWRWQVPRGKQSARYENYGCLYTRTTGIWQTVWLEAVPESSIGRPRITPQLGAGALLVETRIDRPQPDQRLRALVSDAKGEVVTAEAAVDLDLGACLWLAIPEERRRLWSPQDPHLYDLQLELLDGQGGVVDRLQSYAGLRSVAIRGDRFLLNGEPVFQRLVLDQGYYPDGILTAPDDDALRRDIELAQAVGFNGARMHQKIFEERFCYHADRLGYLLWGELPDWNQGLPAAQDREERYNFSYVHEWQQVLERDHSHPSIIGWCPLNETTSKRLDLGEMLWPVTRCLVDAARASDRSRPVIDSSGWTHLIADADIYDVHDYEQDPAVLRERYAELPSLIGRTFCQQGARKIWQLPYQGQPFFVSEFGGTSLAGSAEEGWGYGEAASDEAAFHQRFAALVGVFLDNPAVCGYCWTQLTDVFQEVNGIYGFDRSAKVDLAPLKEAQQRRAAYEERG